MGENIKEPPVELIDIAVINTGDGARDALWRYRKMFRPSCAPWMGPCYHAGNCSYEHINMEGHRMEDGKIYALGHCRECGLIHWEEILGSL